MRPATILAGPVEDAGVGCNLLMQKGFPPGSAGGGSRRGRAAAIGRNQGNPSACDRRGEEGVTPADAAGWTSTPVRADSEEPTRRPRIVRTAGRPFPPPRARPVISGVVDMSRLRPCLFEPRFSRQPLGAELWLLPRVLKYLRHFPSQEQTMNWDRVEGNWKEFKGKVQLQWGKLTNDDLDVIEGKRTELAGRLQQRYGVAKDEAERDIDTWLNGVN